MDAASTIACSTSTCVPWTRQAQPVWLKRLEYTLRISNNEKAARQGAAFISEGMESRPTRRVSMVP